MTHKTAQFTPGPWAVEQCSAPVYGSDGSIIAEGIGIGTQSTHIGTVYGKNNAHNAHLIAAAPTMYEALVRFAKAIKAECYDEDILVDIYHDVRDALAQAEGAHHE